VRRRPKGAPRSPPGNVSDVSDGRKFVKPVVAALGLAGTIASIWWFALKPRRKRAGQGSSESPAGA
jgi:hypothetical protein